jgi:MFS family permease
MTASTQGEGTRILSRQSFLSLYLPAMILALGTGIALPALPVYARSFDVSLGVASLALAASGAGGLAAGFPTGLLLDRIGRRRVILAGPILTAVASLLVANAQSFPELLAFRFVGGMAMQMWMLGRLAIIADTGGANQRGRQITGMHAMDSAGRIAGPLVGGLVATAWDVRVPFLVHAVLCLIAVVPSFILVKETRTVGQRGLGAQGASSADAALNWRVWLLAAPVVTYFVAQFLGAIARGILQDGTLNFYAVYTYGVDAATIGVLGTVAIAMSIPIMVGAGTVMDRFGRKAAIIPGFSLLALALVVMALTAHNQWPFTVYVAVFLLVIATNTITTGNMQILASDIAPPHARGRFFGLTQTNVQIGHVLSPLSFAFLTEKLAASAGFLFVAVLALSVAVIIGLMMRDPIREQRASARAAQS